MSSRRSPRFITWYIAPGYSMRSLRGTEAGCHRRPQVSIVRTDTYSEQAAALGEEAARAQRKSAHIGHGLSSGMGELRTFLIQAPGQRGETLGLKDLANRRGAQGKLLRLEGFADFIDRMVLLAQRNDERAADFLGWARGPGRVTTQAQLAAHLPQQLRA